MDSKERRENPRPDPRIWTEAEREAHRLGKTAWAESPVQTLPIEPYPWQTARI